MWRYKLLLFIFFIPLVMYTAWQSLRQLNSRYFFQRLGLFFSGNSINNGLWFHAASVGEVNAVITLMLKIQKHNPDTPITLSSNTMTSASIAKKQLPESVNYFYFPLDYSWAIKRIINKIKPKAIFIVETEIWPNLYQQATLNKIPLIIINGRVSEKTLHAKTWLKKIYRQILPLVTKVYARSETDKSRFIELGLDVDKIEVLGNIKFSSPTSQLIEPITFNRPYVLAASTREDEEQLIVDAWLKLERKNHLLIIVPRHPHRLNEISDQLKEFNCTIAIRSKNDPVTASTDIYIADTIGELKQFIAGSEFVLMGGSFVEKGGHNILEVAQLGKAVIFGPDMRSFEDEAELFLLHKAGIQCTLAELPALFSHLLINHNYRITIENSARLLINENNNVEKYFHSIKSYF